MHGQPKTKKPAATVAAIQGGVASGSASFGMKVPVLKMLMRVVIRMRMVQRPAMPQTNPLDHGGTPFSPSLGRMPQMQIVLNCLHS